jgi:predicted transcriptional regulator
LNNGDIEKELDTTPNRKRIYQHITNNPGCHLRRISKDLDLAMGDIQYHLSTLEKTSLIKSRRIGVFRMYYTISIFGERQESLLAMLGQEAPRDIIIFLIENPGASQSEIACYKRFSAPTINWHMSRLIEIGLISSRKEGKFVKYYVEGNIKEITSLLKRYYPSIWSKLSNRLAELFLDISAGSRLETNDKKKNIMTTSNEKKGQESDKADSEKLW